MDTTIICCNAPKAISRELFLRNILSKYSEILADNISFSRTKCGRPYSVQLRRKKMDFNVAYAGDKIAIALGYACRVGIDIQSIGEMDIHSSFNFLTQNEISELKSFSNKKKRLCQIWTIKESCAKVIGRGLGCDFKKMIISTGKERNSFTVVYGNNEWNAKIFYSEKKYIVAVCASLGVELASVISKK
jgi:phosphopantetheinyl transferase